MVDNIETQRDITTDNDDTQAHSEEKTLTQRRKTDITENYITHLCKQRQDRQQLAKEKV
jgi:hypothetical protein